MVRTFPSTSSWGIQVLSHFWVLVFWSALLESTMATFLWRIHQCNLFTCSPVTIPSWVFKNLMVFSPLCVKKGVICTQKEKGVTGRGCQLFRFVPFYLVIYYENTNFWVFCNLSILSFCIFVWNTVAFVGLYDLSLCYLYVKLLNWLTKWRILNVTMLTRF